jgi:hypothetical protein
VECGNNHTLVLTSQGVIFGWGSNQDGELGLSPNPNASHTIDYPTLIESISDHFITAISAGSYSCALNLNGELLIWGRTTYGQFSIPTLIAESSLRLSTIKAGPDGSGMACDLDGKVYLWTFNASPSILEQLEERFISGVEIGNGCFIALGLTSKKSVITPKKRARAPMNKKSVEKI